MIVHLPVEILYEIVKNFNDRRTIARFALTSRRLYEIFADGLYKEIAGKALVWACSKGETKIFDLAIKNFHCRRICYEIATCMNAISEASKGGHMEMVTAVLEMARGLAHGRWPEDMRELKGCLNVGLMKAAEHGHLTIVEEMVAQGAHINVNHFQVKPSPLRLAARENHLHVCKFLLSKEALIDLGCCFNALCEASARGNLEVLKILVEGGGMINIPAELGDTCLMLAAGNGHATTVTYLLEKRADPDRQNRHGETALSIAIAEEHADVVEILTAWEGTVI